MINHHKYFSFGKGNRFHYKAGSIDCFYDLPSEFRKGKGKMFSFGINRKAYEKVYNEISPNKDASIPGPGTYTPKSLNRSFNFTLKPRLKFGSIISISKNPGPGRYDVDSTFNKTGAQFLSKYQSSNTTVFNKDCRFKIFDKKLPGPGEYTPSAAINKEGNYFISKFRSSQVHSFGTLKRRSMMVDRSHLETPGPGFYAAPSEFGDAFNKGTIKVQERAKTAAISMLQNRKGLNANELTQSNNKSNDLEKL